MWRWARFALFSAALTACSATSEPASTTAALKTPCWQTTLSWGSGDGQVGMLPAAEERAAQGANAVAVGPSGETFVLDNHNRRVVRVSASGSSVFVAGIERTAEDLAVGGDGAVAVYSPLQSRAWLYGADATDAGQLDVPRAIRHVSRLTLGPSRQLLITSAYQETIPAGSPAAPVSLATAMTRKREGAAILGDGRGVSVLATPEHTLELLVHRAGGESLRHSIAGSADAARIAGASGQLVCMRTESLSPGTRVDVDRRAICVDALTGVTVLDEAMPEPGAYVPRQELAVGGPAGGPVLASIHPTDDGLVVRACEVTR